MQKLPKFDKDTLLDRRYKLMEQAWELDGKTSVFEQVFVVSPNARLAI